MLRKIKLKKKYAKIAFELRQNANRLALRLHRERQNPRRDMRIFLIGVACVGKTTIGGKLADLLEYQFFDLDHEIEKFFDISIERLQNRFLTRYSFRAEASQGLNATSRSHQQR